MSRSCPPMVRRRPLGPGGSLLGVRQRVQDIEAARCWLAANDPGNPEPTHTVVVNNEATRALIYGLPVNVVVNPIVDPGVAYVIDQAAVDAALRPVWSTL